MVESKDTQVKFAMQRCGRLAFLQEQDIQKLLSEPKYLLECYSKLFSIDGKFFVTKNSINGMADDKGEALQFDAPILMGEAPETINAVVDAMRKAVKREIEQAMKVEGNIIELFNSEYINQAIETVDKINNTCDTEKAMAAGFDALKQYCATLNQKLDLLSKECAKEHSARKKALIQVLVTLNVNHRNFVEHHMLAKAKEFGFPNGANHEWKHDLKFFWSNDEVKARILNYDLDYGYEYLGVKEKLVVSPLTRRCYIELGRCFYQGSGVSLEGPAGTGKSETAKDFYRHLGMYNIVTNCSDMFTADYLAQILEGADQSGASLIFDECNRINSAELGVAMNLFKKQASKKQSGLAITMNPGYAGRTPLPKGMYENFACVPMGLPELFYIYQVKLHSQGLGCVADHLAKCFTATIIQCKEQCSKQGQYDFGLRNGLSAVSMVGKLLQSGASAADSVFSALHHTFFPLFTKEDEIIYMEIVNKHFPGANVVDMPGDFESKFTACFPDATDFHKMKAKQIYTKSLFRDNLMVLNTESKIIEDICAVIQATCSEMTFNEVLDEAFENQMRDQIMKAKENKNHWIIIKGRLDSNIKGVPVGTTYWPEFDDWMGSIIEGKTATFSNGEKLSVPPTTKFVKVTPNVQCMTPASVSRLGIVNMSE